MLKAYLAIMLIGSLGCAARFFISNFFANQFGEVFPLGTLVVNVSGCFVIGIFAAYTRPDGGIAVSPLVRQAVMIGFLGGFTTFSSFSWQTLALLGDGEWGYAVLNVVLSVVLCLLAVWFGQIIALEFTR